MTSVNLKSSSVNFNYWFNVSRIQYYFPTDTWDISTVFLLISFFLVYCLLCFRVVIHGKRTREIRNQKNQISDFFVRGQQYTESGQFEWWDRGRYSTHSYGIYFYFPSRIKFFFFRGGEIKIFNLRISKNVDSKIRYLIFACPHVRVLAVRGQKNQISDFSNLWFRVSALRVLRP